MGPWALENVLQHMPKADPLTPATSSTATGAVSIQELSLVDSIEPPPPTPGISSTVTSSAYQPTPTHSRKCMSRHSTVETDQLPALAQDLMRRLRVTTPRTVLTQQGEPASSREPYAGNQNAVADENPNLPNIARNVEATRQQSRLRVDTKRPPWLELRGLESPSMVSSVASLLAPDDDVLMESPKKAAEPQLLTQLWVDMEGGFEYEATNASNMQSLDDPELMRGKDLSPGNCCTRICIIKKTAVVSVV